MAVKLCSSVNTLLRLVFAVVFSYVFVSSGLVVSLLAIMLLVLWPVSQNAYRWITSGLSYTVLGQIVWLCCDYGDFRIYAYGTEEAYRNFGKEFLLLSSSHRGDLDWVAGFVLGARYRFLHSIRSLPKQSVRYVPGFGQLLWMLEYPFLARNNYQKDKETIAKIAQAYKTYPFPIQVAIYCEGTRFTEEKYAKGVEYAKKNNLPPLKHHLVPRTKGFALLAEHLREGANFTAVYDVGVAYPDNGDHYSHLHILLGKRVDLHWYLRRIPIEELPQSNHDLNTFCYQLFQYKDELYEHFLKNGEYPGPKQTLPPFGRVLWLLRLIVVTWALLLTVLPLVLMYFFLSWQTMSLFLSCCLSVNLVVFGAVLVYARGAQRKDKLKDTASRINGKKVN